MTADWEIAAELAAATQRAERAEAVLKWLVDLHDGPRDTPYYSHRDNAWYLARKVLAARTDTGSVTE